MRDTRKHAIAAANVLRLKTDKKCVEVVLGGTDRPTVRMARMSHQPTQLVDSSCKWLKSANVRSPYLVERTKGIRDFTIRRLRISF